MLLKRKKYSDSQVNNLTEQKDKVKEQLYSLNDKIKDNQKKITDIKNEVNNKNDSLKSQKEQLQSRVEILNTQLEGARENKKSKLVKFKKAETNVIEKQLDTLDKMIFTKVLQFKKDLENMIYKEISNLNLSSIESQQGIVNLHKELLKNIDNEDKSCLFRTIGELKFRFKNTILSAVQKGLNFSFEKYFLTKHSKLIKK